jgi:ankyrin repeat protein
MNSTLFRKLELALSYRKLSQIKSILGKDKSLAYQITNDHLYEWYYNFEFTKLDKLFKMLPKDVVQYLLRGNHVFFLFFARDPKDVKGLYKFIQDYDFNVCVNLTYRDFRFYSYLDVFALNNCMDHECSTFHKKVFEYLYKKTKECYKKEYFLNVLFENIMVINKRPLNTEFLETVLTSDMLKNMDISSPHPLFTAVRLNDISLVQNLLDHKLDINMETGYHSSIINYGLYFLVSEDIIRFLIDKGASINKTDSMLEYPFQTLFMYYQHKKYSYELQNLLLDAIDINHQDVLGNTPMHYIAMDDDWRNYEKVLRTKKINIGIKNKDGMTVYDKLKDDRDFRQLDFIESTQENDVTIPGGEYAKFNLSDSDPLNVLFFMYFLMVNNRSACVPYLNEVIKPAYNTSIYSVASVTVLTNSNLALQIYRDDQGKVFFNDRLKEAIKTSPRDYMYIPVFIQAMQFAHANCVIVDKLLKRVVCFEPNGAHFSIDNVNMQRMYDKIAKYFKDVLPKYTFIYPSQFLPRIGFQMLSQETDNLDSRINDLPGYCMSWCFWFAELYINNPHSNPKDLVNKTIRKMSQKEYLFKEFIRNYANRIFQQKLRLFEDMGITDRIAYSKMLPPNYIIEICQDLNKRMKSILGL